MRRRHDIALSRSCAVTCAVISSGPKQQQKYFDRMGAHLDVKVHDVAVLQEHEAQSQLPRQLPEQDRVDGSLLWILRQHPAWHGISISHF